MLCHAVDSPEPPAPNHPCPAGRPSGRRRSACPEGAGPRQDRRTRGVPPRPKCNERRGWNITSPRPALGAPRCTCRGLSWENWFASDPRNARAGPPGRSRKGQARSAFRNQLADHAPSRRVPMPARGSSRCGAPTVPGARGPFIGPAPTPGVSRDGRAGEAGGDQHGRALRNSPKLFAAFRRGPPPPLAPMSVGVAAGRVRPASMSGLPPPWACSEKKRRKKK